MAETTQEKKTFKWGDTEYLVDDLLKLHADQKQNFYTFARNKGSYDDAALAGLEAAMNNRINAVRNGQAFSADGLLDTDTIDNVSIQTQKKGLFKKEKYVDQDNTEWAKYYLNQLVKQLKPYDKAATTSSKDWDITKHGFEAYLTGQGYNPQDIFQNYDLRDKNNPSNPRAFTQRNEALKQNLTNYLAWLKGKGFDYTKNDSEWDDSHLTDLEDLVTNFDKYAQDPTQIATRLRKIGAGDKYTTAFTSDKWDLSKTNEEIDAENDAKKKEAEDKLIQERLDEFENLAYESRRADKPQYYKGYDGDFTMDWYGDLNASQQAEYGTYLGDDGQTWTNAWGKLMTALRSGTAYTDKNAGILLQGTFKTQPQAFIDLGDGKFLIRDSVTEFGQGTVYDPNSGYTNTVFLGDLSNNNSEIKAIYKQLAYDHMNKKYGTKYDDRPDVLKQGGNLIPKHQYGHAVAYDWGSSKKETLKERAEENGLSEDVQKARDRYIDSDNKSLNNPDAGFTGAEIARLVSIGADIGSMFLDPITGTAVGLGSTLTNFGADIADDGFQWEDVKNLGINVGFDLLGAIPIFGDVVGTGTKITRKLIKWAPRMMGVLAGYQGVKNFDGMMDSWQKMLDKDEDAKMTVQDWRNIAQSISLVTGGVRATRNKVQQSKMRSEARVDGVLGINIRNKNTGEIEQILVDGDTAKRIREAKGSTAEIEKVLNDLDAYKGKFGKDGDLEVNTKSNGSWQSPVHRREVEDGTGNKEWEYRGFRSKGKADVNEVYDFSRVQQGYGVARGFKIPGVSDKLNQWHQDLVARANTNSGVTQADQRGKWTSTGIKDEQTRLLNEAGVEAQVGKVQEAVAARKKYLEDLQGRITETETEIAPYRQKAGGDDLTERLLDAETRLAGLPSKQAVNDAHAGIVARQKAIAAAETRRNDLINSRQKQIADMEAGMNARLQTMNQQLNRMKSRKKLLEAKQAAGTLGKKEATELSNLPGRITTLRKSIRQTKSEIVTNTKRIKDIHGKQLSQIKADIKTARGEIATASSVADYRTEVLAAHAQRQAAMDGQSLQRRLNALQGRKASHDPATAPTQAYRELEAKLNNLRATNGTIGGQTINWDMDAILQRYNVKASDVFQQGGTINRNKLNKFLNYAKR